MYNFATLIAHTVILLCWSIPHLSVLGEGSLICCCCWVFLHFSPLKGFIWVVSPYPNWGSKDRRSHIVNKLRNPLRQFCNLWNLSFKTMTWIVITLYWFYLLSLAHLIWESNNSMDIFLKTCGLTHALSSSVVPGNHVNFPHHLQPEE